MTFKHLLITLIIASLMALSIAFFVEYVLHIPPCKLCIYQRIIFAVLLVASSILLFVKPHVLQGFLLISILFSSSMLAVYHTLVERKIIGSHSKCSSESAIDASFEDYKKSLNEKEIVSCDQVLFRFLKLSMTEWNMLYSCALLNLAVIIFLKNYYNNLKIKR